MNKPTFAVHVIDDPGHPPQVDRAAQRMIDRRCAQAMDGRAISIEPHYRSLFSSLSRVTEIYIAKVLEQFYIENEHEEWSHLDIMIFQSSPQSRDTQNAKGVMGFYHDGIEDTLFFSPNIVLYVMPDSGERIVAAAIHELGHFLRSRSPDWTNGDKPFILGAFDEGLSENLVEAILGSENVIHNNPFNLKTLDLMEGYLLESYKNFEMGNKDIKLNLDGYRLGYFSVRNKVSSGENLIDLFLVSRNVAANIIIDEFNRIRNDLSRTDDQIGD